MFSSRDAISAVAANLAERLPGFKLSRKAAELRMKNRESDYVIAFVSGREIGMHGWSFTTTVGVRHRAIVDAFRGILFPVKMSSKLSAECTLIHYIRPDPSDIKMMSRSLSGEDYEILTITRQWVVDGPWGAGLVSDLLAARIGSEGLPELERYGTISRIADYWRSGGCGGWSKVVSRLFFAEALRLQGDIAAANRVVEAARQEFPEVVSVQSYAEKLKHQVLQVQRGSRYR